MFKRICILSTLMTIGLFLMASCGGGSTGGNGGREITFEDATNTQIKDKLKQWLKNNNFNEEQNFTVNKDLKRGLQLQFPEADSDGTYVKILEEMRKLAGVSDVEMRHQSDGYIEMNPKTAKRLVKALFAR